ncbi:hypothetical protein MMC18_007833 [Xylographa bjoerkii]|nr:hypothetical protein [Xylographa bjoerkii]
MSGQPSGSAGTSAPRSTTNGTVNGAIAMSGSSRPSDGGVGSSGGGGNQAQNMSQQNLNQIVSHGNITSLMLPDTLAGR